MEALSSQRLRRPITSFSSESPRDTRRKEPEEDEEGEEDSFFELELTVPDFDPKIYSPPTPNDKRNTTQSNDKPKGPAFASSGALQGKQSIEKTQVDPKFNFSQSKRKILPIESSFPRPQSPASLLKSAPKFRVFMFRKSKSVSAHSAEKTEGTELRHRGRNFFTLRFKLKEIEPAFSRDSSLRRNRPASCSDSPLLGESNSKRFSREVIHKYLRLVKPLYVKVSRRQTSGAGELSPAGTENRELHGKAPAGFRVVACRHLGKSKSASASATGIMSPARRDDSLLQQHDGIESAILHCKRSFSSSRELSPLSRSSSAHEKSQPLDSARSSSDRTSIS
ncbi:probable membrane-associated kinase regulator 5 [Punica granatum]|uniref:Probable membrane-associated kinase regulator 5 n=1 Tax=Punica granatum TaxID=22663 RepID=A0A6P8CNH9_PUNGR|nr:probable membrane-associated kinase regulator 5 [Punica granatum]